MKQFHLTTVIDTLRHGEKDSNGALTSEGHQQAALKALVLEHLDGNIHIYHSGAERVQRTVSMIKQLIKKNISAAQHEGFSAEVQECIGACSVPESIPQSHIRSELHFLIDPTTKGSYYSAWSDHPSIDEAKERARTLLELDIYSPEEGVALSPKQMAQHVAGLIAEQLSYALATPIEEKNNFINGTHEPVLLSFIGYAFNNFSRPGSSFIESLDRAIDFVEGFHIKAYQSEEGQSLITCTFRNRMCTFTLEELRAFATE